MKDKLFDQLDENKKVDELTFDNLNHVARTIKEDVEEEPKIDNVIIFDDMAAYLWDTQWHVKKNMKRIGYEQKTFPYIYLFFMSNNQIIRTRHQKII